MPPLVLRTVTYFINSLPENEPEAWWKDAIATAAAFLHEAQRQYEAAGYEVQTVRVATRALSAASSAADAAATAVFLERLCLESGITFLSLGVTSSEALLAQGCFSKIAACTSYTSSSFGWKPGMGSVQAQALATAIHDLAEGTAGAGNFRFGVACNVQPGVPFFPVAMAAAGADALGGFAIGTENSGLLHAAFQQAAAAVVASLASQGVVSDGNSDATTAAAAAVGILEAACGSLRATMAAALQPVEALALRLEATTGHRYQGIDASIAPALQPPSLVDSYELLSLGRFGGSGTLAVSERITAALKSLPVRLCGYSGLMLPVCEDTGLARAADEGRISVGTLLSYSAVCGCGLDTVPVPGTRAGQPAAERRALLDATAALLLDVAAMAYRLDKPLSVRLLPVPGGAAGQQTAWKSPYLINCSIMPLD